MISTLVRALRTFSLAVTALAVIHLAAAEQPGRFGGSYRVTDVVEDGSQVHLTVSLTLLNPTNTDIKGGIVTLINSQPEPVLIGSVGTIARLPHLGQATVSKAFTISAAEYARWQSTAQPVFEFLMPTASGTSEVRIQARPIIDPAAAK